MAELHFLSSIEDIMLGGVGVGDFQAGVIIVLVLFCFVSCHIIIPHFQFNGNSVHTTVGLQAFV